MIRVLLALSLGIVAAELRGDPSVPDGGTLQRWCNSGDRGQLCLTGLLLFRCGQNHTELHALGRCLDRARDAAALLDLTAATDEGVKSLAVFPKELVRLMKDPFTLRYLEATRDVLEEAVRHHTPFDLWAHTVRYLGGDTAKALWFIGVLLQDTSPSTEHLTWLRQNPATGVPPEALDVLSDLLDRLEPSQLEREDWRSWLRLYPPMRPAGAERELNPSLYHFYTLGYLAMRLGWLTGDRRLAAFLPFWIDLSYKYKAIAPNRWPLWDPVPFRVADEESRLRDVYGAYLATQWAAGRRGNPIPFREFAERLAADPNGYPKVLYRLP